MDYGTRHSLLNAWDGVQEATEKLNKANKSIPVLPQGKALNPFEIAFDGNFHKAISELDRFKTSLEAGKKEIESRGTDDSKQTLQLLMQDMDQAKTILENKKKDVENEASIDAQIREYGNTTNEIYHKTQAMLDTDRKGAIDYIEEQIRKLQNEFPRPANSTGKPDYIVQPGVQNAYDNAISNLQKYQNKIADEVKRRNEADKLKKELLDQDLKNKKETYLQTINNLVESFNATGLIDNFKGGIEQICQDIEKSIDTSSDARATSILMQPKGEAEKLLNIANHYYTKLDDNLKRLNANQNDFQAKSNLRNIIEQLNRANSFGNNNRITPGIIQAFQNVLDAFETTYQ